MITILYLSVIQSGGAVRRGLLTVLLKETILQEKLLFRFALPLRQILETAAVCWRKAPQLAIGSREKDLTAIPPLKK